MAGRRGGRQVLVHSGLVGRPQTCHVREALWHAGAGVCAREGVLG